MKVAIRADASVEIGTGHVMRCLTLAEALMDESVDVTFMCRPHEGNLIPKLINKGIKVIELSPPNRETDDLAHSHWLGATQKQDAKQCIERLESERFDWLIVDHYGIDERWHKHMRNSAKSIMVIDDLADRTHDCDLLLDQNLGSTEAKYRSLVPEHCSILVGPEYALLRPEFLAWREYSLQRRKSEKPKRLLLNFGGIDRDNYTGQVLELLNATEIPWLEHIEVVMGAGSPHIESVKALASISPYNMNLIVDAPNMAELMANSDVAIGAAGSTSWERCCLGLPAFLVVLASNQMKIAIELKKEKAAIDLTLDENNKIRLDQSILSLMFKGDRHASMSYFAASLVDGLGVVKVLGFLSESMLWEKM